MMSIPIVSPSAADVLRLPTVPFLARAGAISMAAAVGAILVRMTAQRVLARRDAHVVPLELTNLRCSLSVWLGIGVVGGASVAFQAIVVRSSAAFPKIMSIVVHGLRLCAGLPGDAPYTEMTGGTCLQNASAAADLLCRVLRVPLVPQVSFFGVNVVPLSDADQAALFGGGGSGERFFTPSRLLALTLQCVFAVGAARAAQYTLRTVISPAAIFPRPWWHLRSWVAAAPLAMWEVLLLAGDCEVVGPIPTPTVYAGLLAANALVINQRLWSRYPRGQPPSATAVDLERKMLSYSTELHLEYASESVLGEVLLSHVFFLIRENSTSTLAGALFQLGEAALSESSTILSECGIDNLGNLEDVWGGDRDRVPVVCGLCNVLFRSTGIVRMPCCGEYLHASCLASLFSVPHRRCCPRCEAPHPRTISDSSAMDFLNEVRALESTDEVLDKLQTQARNLSGWVFELVGVRRRLVGPQPVVLSTQDFLTALFRHPSPTPVMTRTASILSDVMVAYHEASALACIAAALLFPIPTVTLFPERLYSPGLGSVMTFRSLTLPGRALSAFGTLLHFYIPDYNDAN